MTHLQYSGKGFNDAGQVAFLAQLADGSSGIFLADPDPNAVVLDWGGHITKPIPATLKPIEIDDFSGQETLVESPGLSCTNYFGSPICQSIFQEPQNRLGFGFALPSDPDFWAGTTVVEDAVSVKLFDAGENLLGTLWGDATIDPLFLFPSGFFGVESTVPFIRAEIQPSNYGIFDYRSDGIVFDNLRYELVDLTEPATVPEPATGLGLLVISTIGAGSALRHKQK
ncbi:MAG: PEP-CTERM sorting domain-containing protein [Coleofasciculus sp. A1-SPW-01]|uniref:DUF7453 family protein n=1 Tax=Coleofasciculus sp. A1-SPW-01 TaxID=3070819 RepID=UPI0032F97461